MEKHESFVGEEYEFMSPEERKRKITYKFFEACKKGNTTTLSAILNINDVDINEPDDKKWTGMMYAVINNNLEIVKLLLEKEATIPKPQKEEIKQQEGINDPFVKPLDSSSYGKYTSLHWAAYKANILIASLLLKYNHDPLQIDTGGNSALHQAAASNNLEIFKLFMGLGLDLEMKNSRSHSAIDLTSNPEIKMIIQKALNDNKACQICNKLFSFHNKRHLCYVNEEIICKDCCSSGFYYSDLQANEKNILERRCNNCLKRINQAEAELIHAIKEGDLSNLKEVFNYINTDKIKICVKLRKDAELNIERLYRQKLIIDHINSLKFVADHKIIEKSVFVIDQMLKEAQDRNVNLEVEVIQNAFLEKNRLLAERDLRKLLSNLTIDLSSPENLQELNEKLTNAQLCKVSDEYCSTAVNLAKKIQVNLNAKDLLSTFLAYPIREYPPPEETDPKKKKAAPKPPPKKKKKKEPPFLVPDWAKELKTVIEKVQELKGYLSMTGEIGLDNIYEKNCKEQLLRFDQEIKFRKAEEERLRLLEEENKKKKGKK